MWVLSVTLRYGVNSWCFPIASHSVTPLSLPWNYCYLFYCAMEVVLLIVSYWLCW